MSTLSMTIAQYWLKIASLKAVAWRDTNRLIGRFPVFWDSTYKRPDALEWHSYTCAHLLNNTHLMPLIDVRQ